MKNLDWEGGILCGYKIVGIPICTKLKYFYMKDSIYFSRPKIGSRLITCYSEDFKVIKIKERGHRVRVGKKTYKQPLIYLKSIKN